MKQSWSPGSFVTGIVLGIALTAAPPARAVVISEIHYNPAPGRDTLEFIEITNDHDSPEDISGWSFTEGIRFTFPPATILRGREVLVIGANVDALTASYGIENVMGNYEGRLDGSGERLTLVDHVGIVVESLRYQDRGKWPVAADGMGHSIVLKSLHSDTSEPESWVQSPELGGSPGLGNFPRDRELFADSILIDVGTQWLFRRGREAFSATPLEWTLPEFDDSAWELGPSGFGYGDDDDATVLDDMTGEYISLAIRRRFELREEQIDERHTLSLVIDFDDGFCAYVNGTEVASVNCPAEVLFDQRALRPHEAGIGLGRSFEIPRTLLRSGENVVAIAGFNRNLQDDDFSLIPQLVLRRFTDEKSFAAPTVVFNELFRGGVDSDGWVELYNAADASRDLSGWTLTDSPERTEFFAFPEGTMLPPRGFLVVGQTESGLALSGALVPLWLVGRDGRVEAASVFDPELPPDPVPGPTPRGYSEALFPDGADLRTGDGNHWLTPSPTPGASNEVPRLTDIVINEIYYHPPEDRGGEFLELYNRGDATVDLTGFRFTKGIDFTFTSGASLGPGEYLVLAQDPRLLAEHYGFNQALAYQGNLSDGGENIRLEDAIGNLVDEVRYYDGGLWPLWADGLGASLELVDPRQDNDFAQAWAPSDEASKAEWQRLGFTVDDYAGFGSELKVIFASRGIAHLDDVSIVEQEFDETDIKAIGDEWRFRRGTEPFSSPATAWREPDFDDSDWEVGPSNFGFGEDDVQTSLRDMQSNYTSLALRTRFELTQDTLDSGDTFVLRIRFDDGFCAFLNAVEFANSGCPDPPAWDGTSPLLHSASREKFYRAPSELLRAGENVLAIVGFNRRLVNSDFFLGPRFVQRKRAGVGNNLIPNPGFEADTEPWLISGTHAPSHRITDDAHSGGACLELVATGKGNTRCNGIETDTEPSLEERGEYHVSLWARWIRGSSLLIAHGDFSRGDFPGTRDTNLSGNPMQSRLRLDVPWNLGTPGARNSTRSPGDNLGPVIAAVRHLPASPDPALPVRVEARVADADGVESVRVFFKEDGAEAAYESLELGPTGATTYAGQIPPPAAEQVSYYIEAVDGTGLVGRFPAEAPERTLVYRTDGLTEEPFHLIITKKSQAELSSRVLHSNELVDATVIYDNEQTFYNVGVRYRGSPWGRAQRQGYRLRFGEDQPFKGKSNELNLGTRDIQSDGTAYFFFRRSGTTENRAAASDYKYVPTLLNGRPFSNQVDTAGIFEPVNRKFVRSWFGPEAADNAVVLKADGRMRYSDDCNFTDWDEAVLFHRGENVENYRFYWFHALNRSRDNWQPFVDGTKVLDSRSTTDEEFNRRLESVVDLEAWFRIYAARVLMNDGDGLFQGNGHNGYVLWDPTDRRFHYLPFDMGGAFGGQPDTLLIARDPVARRILRHPRSLRLYYRVLHEFSENYWSTEVAGPYLEALEEATGLGQRALDFITVSTRALPNRLAPFVSPKLRILTNDGEDFTTDLPTVRLEGEASVLAATLRMTQGGSALTPFEPIWTSPTEWTIELPLTAEEERVEIFAFDSGDQPQGLVSITIRRSPLRDFIRGDVTGDSRLNILDPFSTLSFLFRGSPLSCRDAADFDDNGTLNILDPLASLEYSFNGGTPPPPPFPAVGDDPTKDTLECRG